MKARDKDKVEKAKLRAARMAQLQKLQGLQSAGGQLALSAVPDGAVETDAIAGPSAAMLAAGVGAQSSFAVKQGRRTLTTGRENTGAGGAAGYMPGNALEDGSGAVDELDEDGEAGGAAEQQEEEEEGDLYQERSCYLCKNWFKKLHHFYDQFCPGATLDRDSAFLSLFSVSFFCHFLRPLSPAFPPCFCADLYRLSAFLVFHSVR